MSTVKLLLIDEKSIRYGSSSKFYDLFFEKLHNECPELNFSFAKSNDDFYSGDKCSSTRHERWFGPVLY